MVKRSFVYLNGSKRPFPLTYLLSRFHPRLHKHNLKVSGVVELLSPDPRHYVPLGHRHAPLLLVLHSELVAPPLRAHDRAARRAADEVLRPVSPSGEPPVTQVAPLTCPVPVTSSTVLMAGQHFIAEHWGAPSGTAIQLSEGLINVHAVDDEPFLSMLRTGIRTKLWTEAARRWH